MGQMTSNDVERLADLIRIELQEEEKERFAQELNGMLSFIQQLSDVDTEGVEPTSHGISLVNVLREDRVGSSLAIEDVLKNTAEHKESQIKVPNILGE